jgi:di/tricarboxylate transporter
VQIAFTAAVLLMVVTKIVNLREAYESVDWPIIILLGAMIPVGAALETTGGAQLIAGYFEDFEPISARLCIDRCFGGTMFLSDLVNNAAAVVLMAPIAIRIAQGLNVSNDPFPHGDHHRRIMRVPHPIGHQSNTLVMGPAAINLAITGAWVWYWKQLCWLWLFL